MRACSLKVDELTPAQIGYIAAFLDGEGGIQITRTWRNDRDYRMALHPDVYFTNTNLDVLLTIRRWIGGGSLTKRREVANHKDTFVLTVSGVKCILALLKTIRPMLIVKSERADLMMKFCESRLSRKRGKGRRFTKHELRLYTSIRRLNKRGGGAKKRQPMDR